MTSFSSSSSLSSSDLFDERRDYDSAVTREVQASLESADALFYTDGDRAAPSMLAEEMELWRREFPYFQVLGHALPGVPSRDTGVHLVLHDHTGKLEAAAASDDITKCDTDLTVVGRRLSLTSGSLQGTLLVAHQCTPGAFCSDEDRCKFIDFANKGPEPACFWQIVTLTPSLILSVLLDGSASDECPQSALDKCFQALLDFANVHVTVTALVRLPRDPVGCYGDEAGAHVVLVHYTPNAHPPINAHTTRTTAFLGPFFSCASSPGRVVRVVEMQTDSSETLESCFASRSHLISSAHPTVPLSVSHAHCSCTDKHKLPEDELIAAQGVIEETLVMHSESECDPPKEFPVTSLVLDRLFDALWHTLIPILAPSLHTASQSTTSQPTPPPTRLLPLRPQLQPQPMHLSVHNMSERILNRPSSSSLH